MGLDIGRFENPPCEFNVNQNYLEGLLKYRFLSPTPQCLLQIGEVDKNLHFS